jgi:hypothetical protein
MRVQYVGARNYVPAGSHPGRIYSLGNVNKDVTTPEPPEPMVATPGVVGRSFAEAVLFSVVVSVASHFVIQWLTSRR